MTSVKVTTLPSCNPSPPAPGTAPSHWVGNPPTHFDNPWPSFDKGTASHSLSSLLRVRFSRGRNFVPIPTTRDELVKVRTPDWGRSIPGWQDKLKATWLGHAGFLVELPCTPQPDGTTKTERGVRILFDAVFDERFSPVSFAGPKRFTPTPCDISELPDIDVLVLSHNHYDHLAFSTIKHVYETRKGKVHIVAGLNNKSWFLNAGLGIQDHEVTECDWWDSVGVEVPGVGAMRLTCCPAQHFSARGIRDQGHSLWCSWVVEELVPRAAAAATDGAGEKDPVMGKKLYFSGDTAYKSTHAPSPNPEFAKIGQFLGPFDLALLPIGCYSPVEFMSNVHASPEDSLEIHKAVRSKKSIGMHYGVIRGGLSSQYEPVTEPPKRWRECCEKEGRWQSGECGLCDVGETVQV